jgi:hopene-associated glycosyltransferase HpnB
MIALAVTLLSVAVWLALLLSPAQPHRTRERLEARAFDGAKLDDVTVLMPARNESLVIERALAGLAAQGEGLEVLVLDDHSEDGTAAVASRAPHGVRSTFAVLSVPPLPPGWSGKLWALAQGLDRARRRYTLLIDADIELAPGMIATLRDHLERHDVKLVSVMAKLPCTTFWERLLVPPFVFFFKLIYPFASVNRRGSRVAAAAGGCIFAVTETLREVGGFAAIKGALIDDCALAAQFKRRGHGIWLGLSYSVCSLRGYPGLADFWQTVRRTAFTQLRCSPLLLFGTLLLLGVAFWGPAIAVALAPGAPTILLAAAAWIAMALAYRPMLGFYELPLGWTAMLPVASALFALMTLSSALGYWRGERGRWKNRRYAASL